MILSQLTQSTIFTNYTRLIMILTCLLSFGRISALHNYYHAPMDVYSFFQSYELPRLAISTFPSLYPPIDPTLPTANFTLAIEEAQVRIELDPLAGLELRLCLGKEWHRYPSSFLVPDEVEVRFIKSAFDGILPKVWEESGDGKGLFDRATGVVPSGMNGLNKEELDRYVSRPLPSFTTLSLSRSTLTLHLNKVDISTCHYLIDLDNPHRTLSTPPLEPRYAIDSTNWERTFCAPFLDNESSSRWTRSLNLPFPAWQKKNKFGDYCLLKNKNKKLL